MHCCPKTTTNLNCLEKLKLSRDRTEDLKSLSIYLASGVSDDLGPAVGKGDPVGAGGVVTVPLLGGVEVGVGVVVLHGVGERVLGRLIVLDGGRVVGGGWGAVGGGVGGVGAIGAGNGGYGQDTSECQLKKIALNNFFFNRARSLKKTFSIFFFRGFKCLYCRRKINNKAPLYMEPCYAYARLCPGPGPPVPRRISMFFLKKAMVRVTTHRRFTFLEYIDQKILHHMDCI